MHWIVYFDNDIDTHTLLSVAIHFNTVLSVRAVTSFQYLARVRLFLFFSHHGPVSCSLVFAISAFGCYLCVGISHFQWSEFFSVFISEYASSLSLSVSCAHTCVRTRSFFPLHFLLYKYQPHSYFGFSFGLVGLCFAFALVFILVSVYTFVLVNGFDISDALPISSCWNAMNHCFHSI